MFTTDSTAWPPGHPASQLQSILLYAGRSSRGPPSLHPPRPRVRRFVSPALFQSLCHWALLAAGHAASGTYRVSLGCLAADQAGQELLHTELLVLYLCGTLTIATDVPGTRGFRHASHVSKPSLSRGSIAAKKKRAETLAPPRWSQARYSSELRTDGAGSVTPSGSHRSSRARRARRARRAKRACTVGIQLSLHDTAATQYFQLTGTHCHELPDRERKLGNQRLWIPTKLNAADDVDYRFPMSRLLEAYLLADKTEPCHAGCCNLRIPAYHCVSSRIDANEGYLFHLSKHTISDAERACFLGVYTSVFAIPRKLLY